MTLHINEIGVKLAVGDEPPESAPAAPTPSASPNRVSALVSACVQRVLQTLRLRQSR